MNWLKNLYLRQKDLFQNKERYLCQLYEMFLPLKIYMLDDI